MAMRATSLVPSASAKALICVDGLRNFEIAGTIYNTYLPEPAEFQSINGVISIMETIFETIESPQSYYEYRSFNHNQKAAHKKANETEVHQKMQEDIFADKQGKKATFVVQVQFRQNATWQGTITWTEEKKVQRFRSTLEMIKLMGDALGDMDEEHVEWE